MSEHLCAALILPTAHGDPIATLGALNGQSVAPSSILLVAGRPLADPLTVPAPMRAGTIAEALHLAAGLAPWVWLLDSGVVPEPSALEELLDALDAMPAAPPPALLASQVFTSSGALDRASIPALEVTRPARVLSALENRTVALRAARYGSLLVHAPSAIEVGAAAGHGGAAHDLAWTARLLVDGVGVLVPRSAVIRSSGRRSVRSLSRPADLLGAARLLAGLSPLERLWFFARLVGGTPEG